MKISKIFEDKIYLNKILNKDIWENNQLKQEVKDKLLEIAMTFFGFLKVKNLIVEDIIITGSMSQYNYTKESDIDLHFIVDFNNLPEDCPIPFDDYFNSKKKIFNLEHDISIYGHPVEIYVEDSNVPSESKGKYSLLKDEWIIFPLKSKIEYFEYDSEKLKEIVKEINDVLTTDFNAEIAQSILDKIYEMRKSGLSLGGESSEGNVIFKLLRNGGYIKKLQDYIRKNEDANLSLY